MAATITYRKTKTGEWVAFGPATAIKANRSITVTKKDGTTKTERVERVGKPFNVNGTEMVYGYLAENRPVTPLPPGLRSMQIRNGVHVSRRSNWGCDDCQAIEDMGDGRGCQRHRGNPQN